MGNNFSKVGNQKENELEKHWRRKVAILSTTSYKSPLSTILALSDRNPSSATECILLVTDFISHFFIHMTKDNGRAPNGEIPIRPMHFVEHTLHASTTISIYSSTLFY